MEERAVRASAEAAALLEREAKEAKREEAACRRRAQRLNESARVIREAMAAGGLMVTTERRDPGGQSASKSEVPNLQEKPTRSSAA